MKERPRRDFRIRLARYFDENRPVVIQCSHQARFEFGRVFGSRCDGAKTLGELDEVRIPQTFTDEVSVEHYFLIAQDVSGTHV
jgi:hypothetical protein